MEDNNKELTLGEKIVGITFNPANDPKVQEVKTLAARMIDILEEHASTSPASPVKIELFSHALGEVLNAQMNVVKVLTFKY